MTSPRVLCLGEVLFDYLADQPGRPYKAVTSWTAYPGGAPANVACALTKLGTQAGFVGCVGQDEAGDTLVDLLHAITVDVTGVQRHSTAPTRSIYVVRSEGGDRQFAGFGDRTSAEFADTRLQADHLPEQLFMEADYLVLGTLEVPYADTRAALHRALELADQYYLKLVLDVNWRPMFWDDPEAAWGSIHELIKQVDFLKLSAEEADWLFKTRDPRAIAERIESIEGVLVTDGDQGCSYDVSGHQGHVPSFKVEVEDTTGAGDAFVAGFLHQLCQQGIAALNDAAAVHGMMVYASAVGALTTIRPGAIAAQPSAAEVDAFLYINQRSSES